MIRRFISKIPNKLLNIFILLFGFGVLFSLFDIETLKKIEIKDIAAIASTVENFVPTGVLSMFKIMAVKITICIIFIVLVVLRALKLTTMRQKTIVINHSSFSNAQSRYDEAAVSKCRVRQVDIDLVKQLGQGEITKAICIQDEAIKKILNRCNEHTEIVYYGIAHIPFIFRAGFQIGNEGKVRLLHKYRNEQGPFKELSYEPDDYKIQLKNTEVVSRENGANEMLVVIETSFQVKEGDLNVFQDKSIGYEMHFELNNEVSYGVDAVTTYAVINRLRTNIMEKIREAVNQHSIRCIHLVLATSSDFAFFLAQDFSRYHDPEVITYQYERNDPRKYTWGISNIQNHEHAIRSTACLTEADNI